MRENKKDGIPTAAVPSAEDRERAVILGLVFTSEGDTEEAETASLDELEELCKACGMEVLAKLMQKRDAPDPATCAGKGKIEEMIEAAGQTGANTLVFNCRLSGSQMARISEMSEYKILDRTLVILDIFARRAQTSEGVLQVEIAQLKDRLSRLIGSGRALSRLGGGIGTRGPGETKLETDRRHIQRRITALNRKLKRLSERRERTRNKRDEQQAYTFAVCGYTNAGKSSLVNRLCGADLAAFDQVFATLDPTARRLPDEGPDILLCDTVGFIRKLPHDLVEAFKSTLDEVREADFILQVTDLSDPDVLRHFELMEEMFLSLGVADKPRIHVLNKIDLCDEERRKMRFYRERLNEDIQELEVSVKDGTGLEALKEALKEMVKKQLEHYELCLTYEQQELLAELRKSAFIEDIVYEDEGIRLSFSVSKSKRGFILPVIKAKQNVTA